MIRILVILVIVYFVFRFLQWFASSAPNAIKQRFSYSLLLIVGAILVFLIVSGRLNWLVPVVGGLVAMLLRASPYLLRFAPLLKRYWDQYRSHKHSASSGSVSTVETDYLRMRLDHDSGEISGEVTGGAFSGRALDRLELGELNELLKEFRRLDSDSAVLLESYLDRVYADEWREHGYTDEGSPAGRSSSSGPMDEEEARRVLGLAEGFDRAQVVAAHRRLMQKLHPDRGGSDYLAAKINQAKDVLMKPD